MEHNYNITSILLLVSRRTTVTVKIHTQYMFRGKSYCPQVMYALNLLKPTGYVIHQQV
jgi:hypothetical protein